MANRKYEQGTVLSVPLGADRVGFCRLLRSAFVEFFDVSRPGPDGIDLDELSRTPIAFRIPVMNAAVNNRRWKVVGRLPLSPEEEREIYRCFKQDSISGALTVFWVDPVSEAEHEEPASIEECAGLEAAAVWSANHVEDRLRDHFDGRPNAWVESLRPR